MASTAPWLHYSPGFKITCANSFPSPNPSSAAAAASSSSPSCSSFDNRQAFGWNWNNFSNFSEGVGYIEEGQRLRLEVPREAFAMHISRAEWISEILLQLKLVSVLRVVLVFSVNKKYRSRNTVANGGALEVVKSLVFGLWGPCPILLSWFGKHGREGIAASSLVLDGALLEEVELDDLSKGGYALHMRLFILKLCGINNIWKQQSIRAQAMGTTQGNGTSPRASALVKDEPDHLLVLVHGIMASPSDWIYVEAELKRRLGRNFLIYASSCNTFTKTFAGIDGAGKRLADEVMQVVKRTDSLKRISFLAHSLGGLFARYAISELYSPAAFSTDECDKVPASTNSKSKTASPSRRGLVAGLEPVNFITLATPHLGVRGKKQGCIAVVSMAFGSGFLSCLVRIVVAVSCGGMCSKKRGRLVRRADKTMYMDKQEKKACKNGRAENRSDDVGADTQLPLLLGFPILEKLAPSIASIFVGRTGSQLFLTDGKANKPPLLLRMASDCEDGKFISALGAFRCRILYANVSYDHMVGWRTSSIRRETELFKPPRQSLNGYKHVVDVEYYPPVSSDGPHFPPEAAKAKAAAQNAPNTENTVEYHEIMEEEMIRGLQQLGWKKVDVSFHSAIWPFFAHNNIHVKNEWFHNAGAGVVAHVADSLKQQETLQDANSFIVASL
ncbi:hypothetical protein RHSIM_Rhsim02G0141300 [Rhododendron simsii]|uniref:DUF676 domain-containing protein n=1 Tax=Rhododendron simsii TaxID=118357 RepID=A0A834LU62_RHOSS|nr:hypothetical protein RHSIM_Rhsim02G0141300 [Rhododendron simsii]